MKAMILAAGLGTRLRPLTDNRPKALVEVGGRTLLEITLSRLRKFGIGEVIINVHHFADMVISHLKANSNFGMRIEISREDVLLDTGGGLKKAASFLNDSGGHSGKDAPFILHNVDVISTIDLGRMVQLHANNHALATLAVQERETSRYLLFDERRQLCGRRSTRGQAPELIRSRRAWTLLQPRPAQQLQAWAFSGVHIISPRIFSMMTEDGAFSIIDSYLRLAAQNEKVLAFRADEYYWRDLGRPENITKAEQDLKDNLFSL